MRIIFTGCTSISGNASKQKVKLFYLLWTHPQTVCKNINYFVKKYSEMYAMVYNYACFQAQITKLIFTECVLFYCMKQVNCCKAVLHKILTFFSLVMSPIIV